MSIDLIDDLRTMPEDRAIFRAAMRRSLVRHAAACREEADLPHVDPEQRDELLADAHAAMIRALDWEA